MQVRGCSPFPPSCLLSILGTARRVGETEAVVDDLRAARLAVATGALTVRDARGGFGHLYGSSAEALAAGGAGRWASCCHPRAGIAGRDGQAKFLNPLRRQYSEDRLIPLFQLKVLLLGSGLLRGVAVSPGRGVARLAVCSSPGRSESHRNASDQNDPSREPRPGCSPGAGVIAAWWRQDRPNLPRCPPTRRQEGEHDRAAPKRQLPHLLPTRRRETPAAPGALP